MASQEHLQMLHDDDSETSTSDDDETSSENGASTEFLAPEPEFKEAPVVNADESVTIVASVPAKKRIKLSLGYLKKKSEAKWRADDMKAEPSEPEPKPNPLAEGKTKLELASIEEDTGTGDEGEVKAMVVDSDEGGEDDAVAAVLEEVTPKEPAVRKKPVNVARIVRLPPMPSPGLLIPPVSGVCKGIVNEKGLTTPASVFDSAMSLAGYTTEGRTKQPHRGSSIQRVVGDMFDSNVKFSLHFPTLVPRELLLSTKSEVKSETQTNGVSQGSLPDRLIKAFRTNASGSMKNEDGPRKRRKLAQFSDMVPLSLSIPYPEWYIKKRLEFVEKVKEREKAIIAYQEAEETLEIELEKSESRGQFKSEDWKPPKPQIDIPPIPVPPSPPKLSDMDGVDPDLFDDQYPLYTPKGDQQFVAHLDKECFHVVDGRYFGLLTTSIADPHFVGPNAPGISALNVSGASGLSTFQTGGGGYSSGGALLSAPPQSVTTGSSSSAPSKGAHGSHSKSEQKKNSTSPSASLGGAESKKNGNGPNPTASSSALRKLVEEGGEFAEKMKTCIIRAAVHASRSGQHGRSFKAPNGEVYPDISKAFAVHAGLKPCNRCKNNKQGAYHCRLRRRHKELDYDGGDSPAVLAPLFKVPMDELLWKADKG